MKLYYYEYCTSSMGLWSRDWFASEEQAKAARAATIEEFGEDVCTESEEVSGAYGDVGVVEYADIELTPEGILEFAQNWGNGS